LILQHAKWGGRPLSASASLVEHLLVHAFSLSLCPRIVATVLQSLYAIDDDAIAPFIEERTAKVPRFIDQELTACDRADCRIGELTLLLHLCKDDLRDGVATQHVTGRLVVRLMRPFSAYVFHFSNSSRRGYPSK